MAKELAWLKCKQGFGHVNIEVSLAKPRVTSNLGKYKSEKLRSTFNKITLAHINMCHYINILRTPATTQSQSNIRHPPTILSHSKHPNQIQIRNQRSQISFSRIFSPRVSPERTSCLCRPVLEIEQIATADRLPCPNGTSHSPLY